MVKKAPQPEFSRAIAVDRIGEGNLLERVEASAEERAALARRFDLLSLQRLTATVRLRRLEAGLFRVAGSYEADVVQSCVVTLKPVPAHLEGAFTIHYALGAEAAAAASAPGTEEDPPEPLVDGKIDLGEALAQEMAVALDPYPRAPDAALPEELAGDAGAGSPFAALAKLKQTEGRG